MKAAVITIVVCLAIGLFFVPDLLVRTQSSEEAQLHKAVEFVRQCTDEYYLREDTSFLLSELEHSPSDWLEYFFSPYASRNWVFEGEYDADYVLDIPTKPRDVALLPDLPNIEQTARFQKQATVPLRLYIHADDLSRTINVKGVIAHSEKVVVTASWPFPEF